MDEGITIRRASEADAVQLSALFQLVYHHSSHPFQSVGDVEQFLADPRNFEFVAEARGRVVASMAMAYYPWNSSYELGRALTHPDWRSHGLAPTLMQHVIDAVCDAAAVQVFFGYPRVRRMVDLCALLAPPMIVAGHDAGRNVANGARESHLITYAVPPHARLVHVAPPEAVAGSAFVRESIYRPLGLQGQPGAYPAEAFVAMPCTESFQSGDFLVAYDATSAHRGIEILAHGARDLDHSEICEEFDALFRKFPDVRHVTVTVLADKVDLLRDLRGYGFEVSAYLPAWYQAGGRRFDCLQLAKRAYAERPRVQGFQDVLERLEAGLDSIVAGQPGAARPGVEASRQRLKGSGFRIMVQRPTALAAAQRAEHGSLPTWRPLFYRLSSEDDRLALADRIGRDGARMRIYDTTPQQVRDLIRTRHPGEHLSAADLDALAAAHLNGVAVEDYGAWVYYPWSCILVHLLDAHEFGELRTNRNRHKITSEEQAVLAAKRVGIVGLSVGQSVALTLALERAFGELRLADFDSVDVSNLNRIRTGVQNLGVAKVFVTAREIAELDPYLDVKVFSEGITAQNIELFMLNGGKLDVVLEECDSLDIKVIVRHEAKRHGIPVVMDTSDRGMLDIERFDLEPDRPIFHGLAAGLSPDSLSGLTTEQKLPYVLRILGTETVSPRLRASLIEIEQTISTWPQLGSEVTLGGAVAAHAARRIALGQARQSGRVFVDLDAFTPGSAAGPQAVRGHEPAATHGVDLPPRHRRVTDPLIRDLVTYGVLAPSGGNTQPWQWRVSGDALQLFLDRSRGSGLVDFELAGSHVALGCAAENVVLAAHAARRDVRLDPFPDQARPDHVATFVLASATDAAIEPHWRDELFSQMARRQTNRTLAVRQPLPAAHRDALTAAVRSIAGADVQWLTGDAELAEIGELLGAADRLRMLNPSTHREMFRELRWTRDEAESTRDGIDVATLCLSASDRAGLELCRDWPSLDLVRAWRGGRNLEKMAQKYVAAASAVGLITLPGARAVDYFNGGRAVERLWLTATEQGLAVQPMTALPYLFARLLRADGDQLDDDTIAELRRLRQAYERRFELTDQTGEIMLFRVAFGGVPEVRSLRRPLDDVLETSS